MELKKIRFIAMIKLLTKLLSYIVLGIISIYQYTFSSIMGKSCRFYPTCSVYASEAIKIHGLMRGGWMGIKRVLRCHPFNAGGYDPVPEKKEKREEKD